LDVEDGDVGKMPRLQRKEKDLMRRPKRLKTIVSFSLCLTAGCAGLPPGKSGIEPSASQPAEAIKAEWPTISSRVPTPDWSVVEGAQRQQPPRRLDKADEAHSSSKVVLASLQTIGDDLEKAKGDEPNAADQKPPFAEKADVPPAPLASTQEKEHLSSSLEDPLASPQPDAYTVSLEDVIALADAQNPNVAFARERINEAYAFVDRADVLWVPSLRAGLNVNHHEGNIQAAEGEVLNASKTVWYGGLGAAGVGSNSPAVPGLIAQFQLTDAIFQPRITRHQAASRQFNAASVRNDTLRSTSVAYLELVRAEHALAIALEAFQNTRKLVDVTEQFAKTGQGLQSDHERMLAELAIRRVDVVSRQEANHVASVRLAQFLHADPSIPILSGEPAIVPLPLMETGLPVKCYLETGLSRRPELAEQQHLVSEAIERFHREKYAPLVPSVILGMSYGGMGGGEGSSFGNGDDRWDMDAVAYWEVRNLGFGEKAARDATASGIHQAQQRQLVQMDQVAREIVEAHAQVVERERRIEIAKAGVTAAETSYRLNLERIENIQGLPIESLQAVQALALARLTYLNAVIDYNIAQVELVRATGWFEGR
jgi:outer membrane protein TolC